MTLVPSFSADAGRLITTGLAFASAERGAAVAYVLQAIVPVGRF